MEKNRTVRLCLLPAVIAVWLFCSGAAKLETVSPKEQTAVAVTVAEKAQSTVKDEQKGAAEKSQTAVRVINPEEAMERMNSTSEYLLLDVRDWSEFAASHIPGASCIPYLELERHRDELPEDQDMLILVYCRSGRRSAIAAETLLGMGYRNVLDFGGIIDWPYDVTNGEVEENHEHTWMDYDCNYEICSTCGKQRNYQ